MPSRRDVERAFWAEEGSTGSESLDRVLQVAAAGFELGVRLRNWGFDAGLLRQHRVPRPVVCVGNLTVGGSGKTPVVAALAEGLAAQGEAVAVLSRGYGGARDPSSRLIEVPDPARDGDEPALLAALLPSCRVVIGADRVESARIAIASGATVLLLDDGFQHRRLARDVDIVVVDGARGFGNGFMLPRGPLREPPSALRRAHLVLVKEGAGPFRELIGHGIRDLAEGVPVHEFRLEPRGLMRPDGTRDGLDTVRGRRITAMSGIGNPAGFERVLEHLGATVAAQLEFPDHHRYTAADLRRAEDDARRASAAMIVTTAKDFTKLRRFAQEFPVLALEVEAEPVGGFDWIHWVARRLALVRQSSPPVSGAGFDAPSRKTPAGPTASHADTGFGGGFAEFRSRPLGAR